MRGIHFVDIDRFEAGDGTKAEQACQLMAVGTEPDRVGKVPSSTLKTTERPTSLRTQHMRMVK
jgi:hypothetical protein